MPLKLKDASLLRQQSYIDGAWVDADSKQTIAVKNPATGEVIATVPKMGAAELLFFELQKTGSGSSILWIEF